MAQNRIIRPGEQVLRVTPNGLRIALGRGTPIPLGGTPAAAPLKFGPYSGMSGLTGIGPGSDTGDPYYRIVGTNPHTEGASVRQQSVDIADAKDITIFATTPDAPSAFGSGTAAGFDITKYTAKVQTLANDAKYKDAIQRGRVVCIAGDEPYHTKWSPNGNGTLPSTWSPAEVNQCGRIHKQLLGPGTIVVMRADPDKMRFGWDGYAPLATYDGIDYCVMQFEGPQGQSHVTFAQALAQGRIDAAACGLKCLPVINLWAGGNHVTIAGVNPCWDYLNNGSSSGVVLGTVQGGAGAPGDELTCATWTGLASNLKRTLMVSPAWLQAIIDDVYDDPDIPWLPVWAHPVSSIGLTWAVKYNTRADWRDKMDYAITKCLTRPAANPIPAPKVYP